MSLQITVIRYDDGIAKYTFTDGTVTITEWGFWDDASPWPAGGYQGSYSLLHPNSYSLWQSLRLGVPSDPNPLLPRKDILLHYGTSTGASAMFPWEPIS